MIPEAAKRAMERAALKALEAYTTTFEAELNKAGLTTSRIQDLDGHMHEHTAMLADPNTETGIVVTARWTFADATEQLREVLAQKKASGS
jgi:hypothetical protein